MSMTFPKVTPYNFLFSFKLLVYINLGSLRFNHLFYSYLKVFLYKGNLLEKLFNRACNKIVHTFRLYISYVFSHLIYNTHFSVFLFTDKLLSITIEGRCPLMLLKVFTSCSAEVT